ncbi:MAG: HlyD family type I secretion periplasmic adaptor subunit [Desulfovibrio sp.]|uniref:HlyD family type I secretion periplasmic adaptor subunit n=1 Tax=Desulfovibrio sp. TaxID=885 RepID=UPI0025C17240|nr:HlyD family type I secretion periplasmic adaptor subunit [Desulfovibrio sp.]MBS6830956.1 HlyD family type I secretion periplasmic adaptor subunit [Desulfovibrio sp.]
MNALWAKLRAFAGRGEKGEHDDEDDVESFGPIIRHGMIVILLFFGILGGWAVFGEISGAVVVPGTIKIDTERKTVQHLEGGIVDSIEVREGEKVQQGQALITLRSVTVDSSVDMANKNLILFLAARCRYLAEKELFREIEWTEELLNLVETYKSHDVLDGEKKIFVARRASYQSQAEVLESQENQIAEQILGLREELNAEKTIIATLAEELAAKRVLMAKKYLEKSQVLELERSLASHKGNHGKLRQSIAASEQQKNGLKLQREGLSIGVIEQAASEINLLDSKILQTREELRPLRDTKRRLRVVAPVSGRIVGLQVHSPGGVIAPGQQLMDIVPENSPLIAEVHIPVEKIADVHVGQEAQAQLDAFARSQVPLIPARVLQIAADRQEKQTSMGAMPFYLSHVQVFPEAMDTPDIYISPGMPVTVFITTKKQTILHYMFEPLLRSWDRALRE